MQKTLYIPIDTTLDNTVECEKLVKSGDMLILTIKLFTNGVLADLTGQTIDLILKKPDNTIIENAISTVSNGVITAVLTEQATLAQGTVSGEIQIYSSTLSHLGTNTFTFKVDESIADDVLAKSESEIETLADLKAVIDTNNATITEYVSNITQIAGTAESVQALANTKLYIDNNLTALQQANGEAVVNIANEKVQNDKAEINIPALTTTNTNASTLKTGLEADIASGTTLKNTLETDIISGTTLKNGLESDISTGNTLKTNLEADIVTGNTLKTNIDSENVRAEANITAMQGFGDVTQLTQNVTALKTEVENARNGEVSLDARLDKNDVLVASNSTQLSENTQNIATNATNTATNTTNISNHTAKNVTDSGGIHGLAITNGIFTPIITDLGGVQPTSHSIQNGFFQKIGSIVFFSLAVQIGTKGTNMGDTDTHVNQLPFASNSTANRYVSVNIGYSEVVNSGVGKTVMGFISPGSNFITLKVANNDGTGMSDLTTSKLANGSFFMISGQYQV